MNGLLGKIIILLVSGSLAITTGFGLPYGYAGPQEGVECVLSEDAAMGNLDEKEDGENLATLKNICNKLSERTQECRDVLDSLAFTLQSIARKARKNKEAEKEKEALTMLKYYTSVIGDLKAIEVFLATAELISDVDFTRYFDLMTQGYDHLKGDFSLKNELLLERRDQLKDRDIKVYADRLYSAFCKYFEYDFLQDREIWEGSGNGDTYFDCSKHGDGNPEKKGKNCPRKRDRENREER